MYDRSHDKNGLTTVVSRMPGMQSVSLGVWIGVGGRNESRSESGISHLIEHMLFKGTVSRTAKDLKEAIEGVGGMFNGFTSDEVTCYMVKVPAAYMDLGLDVLSDMVMNPRFDKDDLVKEKYVVMEEIKMYRDQPSEHVLDVLGELMWPDHPLGRPLTGTVSTVRALTMDDMVAYKERFYHPGNISVIAAGNVSPDKLFRSAAERFSGRKGGRAYGINTPKKFVKGPRMKVVSDDTQQNHIAIGFRCVGDTLEERFAAKMMNVILGGNMSSRLFEELREKYGLCYDISSSYKRHSDIGELQVHAGVDPGKTLKSIRAILDELKKIKDLGVTAEELDRAKRYAQGQFVLAMEGTSTRMMWLGDRQVVHKEIPEVKEVLRRIEEVTPRQIQRVSEKIFSPGNLNLALVGRINASERSSIKKELSKI